MATKVVDVISVTLDDETVLECKPLKIKYLRKFMDRISNLSELVDDNVKSIDLITDCTEIALEQYAPGKYTRDNLEELLDLPIMYRIIEGASGIVLDNSDESPN